MNEGPLYLMFIMLICMMAFLLSNSIQLNFNFFFENECESDWSPLPILKKK